MKRLKANRLSHLAITEGEENHPLPVNVGAALATINNLYGRGRIASIQIRGSGKHTLCREMTSFNDKRRWTYDGVTLRFLGHTRKVYSPGWNGWYSVRLKPDKPDKPHKPVTFRIIADSQASANQMVCSMERAPLSAIIPPGKRSVTR